MPECSITDRIAAEAARIFEEGGAATVRDAIDCATERLGVDGGRRPSSGRVRQHLQARSMQSLGDAGYRELVADTYRVAEQLMTLLAERLDGVEPLLVGRAARGHVDGDGSLHVRVYTEQPIGAIAEALVSHGYDEPAFETAHTRHGRLSRMRLIDEAHEIVITRCLPEMRASRDTSLFTGRPIETASLDEVRSRAGLAG